MKRSPLDEARRWLRQAEQDLDDAQFAAGGHRHHLACFLAQQSAEKALKAFLYSRGVETVWGHSVAELCRDAADFDGEFRELGRTAGSLDKYYIPTRYPNGLPGGIPAEAFIEADSRSAIEITRRVIGKVQEKVNG
jgi:HEPN domain-containing protein